MHHDGEGRPPAVDACEPLAELLDQVAAADRANARAVELLARLQVTGEAEVVTGVSVELWLLRAGLPATDRRMLTCATTQLGRLPAVADGFARGALSWGQVRTLCLLAHPLSEVDADDLDSRLAPSIDRYAGADPDGLLQIARQIVDRLRSVEVAGEADRAERDRFVAMQPRLDGNGGRLHGELDGLGFGLVAAALSAGAPLPAGRRELVGERADTVEIDQTRRLGRWRADRLVQLCADDLARRGQPLTPGAPLTADAPTLEVETDDEADRDRTRALVPEATLVLDLDQLIGRDGLPVELLTALTGGRLKVASSTARRWLDEAGCRLRTIVLDDTGQLLGVGRATRQPPGWLTDATRATDATCRAPGCRTAASVCDLDHHLPWHPTRPDAPAGTTDTHNLGPLCRTDNRSKERQGWQIASHPDGTTGWTHPRSGYSVRTLPWATARAAARPPRGQPPDRPPPRRTPDRASTLERRATRLLTRSRDPDPPPF